MSTVDTDNPCKADWERRKRALRDSALVERIGPMERRIDFEVGYDHCAHPEACGGGGHGRHGMTMAFILVGPSGAVQWKVTMPNWVPGNVNVIDNVQAQEPFAVVPIRWPRIGDVYPSDLGYHRPTRPAWDDDEWMTERECHLLPEGTCFYDGSGLNAGPVLAAFLEHGPHAVWAALGRYYEETLA